MKQLQRMLLQLRTARRRAEARLGRTNPSRLRPARLVIRLDDADLPGILGEGPRDPLAKWQARLVSAMQWLGPVPVTVLAGQEGGSRLAAELVRFAHRLECPTRLVCDGQGLDRAAAFRLVDIGLDGVRLEVSADHDTAESAIRALREAAQERGVNLDIEVMVTWQGDAAAHAAETLGWARRAGCDGIRVSPPWRSRNLPTDLAPLERLLDDAGTMDRTPAPVREHLRTAVTAQDGEPGVSRGRDSGSRGSGGQHHCPVGGQRLVLAASGDLWCCPFKTAIPSSGTLEEAWAQAGPHLEAIKTCDRSCAHAELAPERVLR